MNLDNVYVEFDILKMISCALMIFSGKELVQYSLYVQFTLSTYHFSCNQCVLLYILRIGCVWRVCWLILHFIVWISIPVVVGLMNPCILDLQHNYGLLLLFSLEEGFGGLIKGWIRICNVLMYLLFLLFFLSFFFFCFVFSCFLLYHLIVHLF